MEEIKSRVYILTDEKNRITRLEGEYSLPSDLNGWTLVDEGYGDKFNLAQSHYLDKPLMAEDGTHNYMWDNAQIREATDAERKTESDSFPAPTPSQEDTIEAQVMYTAMMTDTLL